MTINHSPIWENLIKRQKEAQKKTLLDLHLTTPGRQERYTTKFPTISLDYSKNHLDGATLALLFELAEHAHLQKNIRALFSGEHVNTTEKKPALHTALRNKEAFIKNNLLNHTHTVVQQNIERIIEFCQRQNTKKLTDIVHIGIGGSALGPELAIQALKPLHKKNLNCHFVSNIDPEVLEETLMVINPKTTLFVVTSKSFNTIEVLTNAMLAKDWLITKTQDTHCIKNQFIALTENTEKAQEFGIENKNIFPIWPWVGGRYSLWSSAGLPIALMLGTENFLALLAGAHEMDKHFIEAPMKENLPILLALISIWYRNFFNTSNHAIIPYAHCLRLLPAYLQQLEMESNGKNYTIHNNAVPYKTAPVIFGMEGTNSQHSFHQLLHQGTELVPVDFIAVKDKHPALLANCQAQIQALMTGEKTEEFFRCLPGNRPSSLLILDSVTPYTLGALLALYEHKVFTQSVIWQTNAFDQWGVELGKKLASKLNQSSK